MFSILLIINSLGFQPRFAISRIQHSATAIIFHCFWSMRINMPKLHKYTSQRRIFISHKYLSRKEKKFFPFRTISNNDRQNTQDASKKNFFSSIIYKEFHLRKIFFTLSQTRIKSFQFFFTDVLKEKICIYWKFLLV